VRRGIRERYRDDVGRNKLLEKPGKAQEVAFISQVTYGCFISYNFKALLNGTPIEHLMFR
jgi:hypothetical protein